MCVQGCVLVRRTIARHLPSSIAVPLYLWTYAVIVIHRGGGGGGNYTEIVMLSISNIILVLML